MVGLVIVSHSQALVKSLAALVRQVAKPDLPMATAGGVGPERVEFGTDANEIKEAIQSVYSPDGVVVLMDLGSAVLSAQMALDFLPPEMAERVYLCAAPIVEGCIAAAVQIGLGSDAQTVCQEAMQSLKPKQEQLGVPGEEKAAADAEPASETQPDQAQQVTLTLKNEHGLHARPAARFVQTAATFDADIRVRNESSGRGPVKGKSLIAIATLAASRGDTITILASGHDAKEAIEALKKLVDESLKE